MKERERMLLYETRPQRSHYDIRGETSEPDSVCCGRICLSIRWDLLSSCPMDMRAACVELTKVILMDVPAMLRLIPEHRTVR